MTNKTKEIPFGSILDWRGSLILSIAFGGILFTPYLTDLANKINEFIPLIMAPFFVFCIGLTINGLVHIRPRK